MYDDLIRSIMKACRIMGKEFTEADIPSNPNVYKELVLMNKKAWKEVERRNHDLRDLQRQSKVHK